jgi:hypothetical protein
LVFLSPLVVEKIETLVVELVGRLSSAGSSDLFQNARLPRLSQPPTTPR